MFAQLPEPIKRQVIEYLAHDNFTAAKELHDAWLRTHSPTPDSSSKHKKPRSKNNNFHKN